MQEILDFLFNQFGDNPWFILVTSLVTLASAVAAVTPTPKKGSFLSKVYKVIDILAFNIGKAKYVGDDEIDGKIKEAKKDKRI